MWLREVLRAAARKWGNTLLFSLTFGSFCVCSLNTCNAPGQAGAKWRDPVMSDAGMSPALLEFAV